VLHEARSPVRGFCSSIDLDAQPDSNTIAPTNTKAKQIDSAPWAAPGLRMDRIMTLSALPQPHARRVAVEELDTSSAIGK
jgi:hypothetical protein